MNRLTRDQIITRALDMADAPTLNAKERPSGAILPTAMSIGWLQDGLDFFHTRFPWGSTIQTTSITWVTGQETYALPSTFIADVRDGIIHASDQGRMMRKGLPWLLDIGKSSASQYGKPSFYAVVGGNLYVRPVPSAQWISQVPTSTLYYYQLPAALAASGVPSFPSDLVLVRYVYLRAMEWLRSVPPGMAEQYGVSVLADLQKQGIGNEAEDTQIPFDRNAFPGNRQGHDPNSWMGSPIAL